jgi:hypothetical protein
LVARGTVIIPVSPLAFQLAEIAALKKQAESMLADLENQAKPTVAANRKPGGWRQNPLAWNETKS